MFFYLSSLILRAIRDCGENEVFSSCKGCEATCENPKPTCPHTCLPGCFCDAEESLVRKKGRCVPTEACRPANPIDVCKGFKCRAGTYCKPQHVKPCPDLTKVCEEKAVCVKF
uniref:TIL domain-containing protein n=1 Tax=Steinernema glaseri TaxID=37863 RepID=A0A1I7ZP44_9BILA